ncbi:hypothetical protein DAPPUDRAFT_113840 [Daphnia pulex]|uniref:Uncharacterized protein n=1 Tax=Daphnia pulex TaxID=6669 RepID=E9HGA0_DAPPU|nr:hypothetical protein DAPPUDRAFT_113840 [Daphnia pulex]|eukprot:EFX69237.1 hypothetical protein DAPPUDRAFT_113840 [Daphnia pulex]
MYERIRKQHARTAADNRLILLQQFTEYKFQQGHNVTSHVTALELLWSRLTEIGEHILESQVIAKILSTLPSTYRHFYTTWNNSPEAGRTVKFLLTKLQEEEAITQAFNRNNPPTEEAYVAPNYFQNPAQRNQNQSLQQPYSRPHPYSTSRGGHQGGRGGYQSGRGGYPGVRGGYRGGFRGGFRGFRSGPQVQGELCSYCGLDSTEDPKTDDSTSADRQSADDKQEQSESSTKMAEDKAVEVPHTEEDAARAEETSNNEELAAQAEETSNN